MSSGVWPNNSNNANKISALRLRQVFDNLSKALGRSITDLLVYDLERQGIAPDKDE
jgi:hypothetical protein